MRLCPVLVLLLGALTSVTIEARPESRGGGSIPKAPDITRIRTGEPRVARAIIEGATRSPRMADLISRIESSDVIVYIRRTPQFHGRLAGGLTFLSATSTFRYVQIFLDPEITGDQLIATLGHEFQHVVEISEERSIVSDATLSDHYRRIGIATRTNGEEWETQAAKDVGRQVRRELGQAVAVAGM